MTFDSGGDCDDEDPAVGWSYDCVYATLTNGIGAVGFGTDLEVTDVDGDGGQDVVVLWLQDRRVDDWSVITTVLGPISPGTTPRSEMNSAFAYRFTTDNNFAVADFSADGSKSVLLSSTRGVETIWVTDLLGESSYRPLAVPSYFSISAGEVDGDGFANDVVVRARPYQRGNVGHSELQVVTFTDSEPGTPAVLVADVRIDSGTLVGDLDGDGLDNLVVTGLDSEGARVWWGDAATESGTVEDIAVGSWQSEEVESIGAVGRGGDQNGDGYPEILLTPFEGTEVWIAQGGPDLNLGTWVAVLQTDSTLYETTPGADLNRDGLADLWLASNPPVPPLFAPIEGVIELEGVNAATAAIGDVDGDGRLDLVARNLNANAPSASAYEALIYLGSPDW
jgi:hypothetical protein